MNSNDHMFAAERQPDAVAIFSQIIHSDNRTENVCNNRTENVSNNRTENWYFRWSFYSSYIFWQIFARISYDRFTEVMSWALTHGTPSQVPNGGYVVCNVYACTFPLAIGACNFLHPVTRLHSACFTSDAADQICIRTNRNLWVVACFNIG